MVGWRPARDPSRPLGSRHMAQLGMQLHAYASGCRREGRDGLRSVSAGSLRSADPSDVSGQTARNCAPAGDDPSARRWPVSDPARTVHSHCTCL